jgi:iron complex outermembrane receptor protein
LLRNPGILPVIAGETMRSNRVLKTAIAIALAGLSGVAFAQEAPNTVSELETVIVTGTYIRGAAEDAALPVDVISTEELEKQGTPAPLDLLKSLTVVNGVIGESNRFTSGRGQAANGSAEINLRGFGAARTLVLLNGKRLATGDANLMPSNAIERIEILKDGGSTTYGSDAIGGVVNFITKENMEGFEFTGDYRNIQDSDGDYTAGIAWGTSGASSDLLLTFNYFHRSQLLASDRDWAIRPFLENPQGGWSQASSPGAFQVRTFNGAAYATTATRVDSGCTSFGGFNTGTNCFGQFTQWDNLVDEQNTYQAFAQYKVDLGDTTSLKIEGLYAFTEVPEAGATPSGATTRLITSTVLPTGAPELAGLIPTASAVQDPSRVNFFYVPISNPGFTGAFAPGGTLVPTGAVAAFIPVNSWRPFLNTGNTAYDNGRPTYAFERDNARLSGELTGELGDINWMTSLTYGMAKTLREEDDISTARLQLALRGLGGEGCDYLTGTPGVGACQWFNPFSTAMPAGRNGFINSGYVGAANSGALVKWLEDDMEARSKTQLGEFNVVLSGELDFLSLPGGQMGWAAGGQYRHTWFEQTYGNSSNKATNPCVDTPVTGTTTCAPTGESPYNFLATYNQVDVDRGVYAAFAELSLPILDSLSAQVAARFEDYGDQGGSSFDPKLSIKWQLIDQLALRGSVSTTFRAPPQTSLIEDEAIAFSTILGSNRPVGTVGNAALEPEESFQWSVGAIVNVGNFRAMVDFWRFDIDKLLTVEPLAGLVSIVFPNGAAPAANNCATVDPEFLAAHFDFGGAACSSTNLIKVRRQQINGAGLRNDGIDFSLDYTFDNLAGGTLTIGSNGTWLQTYKTETLIVDGVIYERGFDGVGKLNRDTSLFALPEWRVQGYVDYGFNNHNIRWTTNYIDHLRDQRDGITREGRVDANIFTASSPNGRVVSSTILHNLTYRVQMPTELTLLLTVENLADSDPEFVRFEMNYDPLTAQSQLGRTVKVGVRKKF